MDTLRLGLSIVPCFMAAFSVAALGAGDTVKGAKVFQACAACHSLQAGRNMTGPSLHGIWGRKAGAAPDFIRYSDALRRSGVVWNQNNLDRWLTNPAALIPGNNMTFAGIDNRAARADLIAFLHLASEGKAPSTGEPQSGGMMGQGEMHNLKHMELAHQVRAIRYCKDSYFVSTEDGKTHSFWEANLRFKSDSSDLGPVRGQPVILPAGMMGDRASVFFSDPEEISASIKKKC